jgi:hydrophobe/amphiphile efflux-1 (HAE1) family protein
MKENINKTVKNIIKPLGLPNFSVRRPISVLMIYIGLLVLSIYSFTRMGLDLFPDITYPTISVITTYTGAGPEEVEEKITKPVESQLSIVQNLDKITSISREGVSSVQLKFAWGTNLDEAANDIRDKLGTIRRLIPDEADDPLIFRFNFQDIPVIFIGATAGESYPKLYDLLDRDISDMLKRIPGVGNISVMGGQPRQININVDRQKLEARNLTLIDIKNALVNNNLMLAAGDLKIATIDYLLKVPGEYSNVDEIKETPVGSYQGNIVKIKDIAEVEDSYPEEKSKAMINGKTGAMMMIQKRSEANTVNVCDSIKKMIPELQKRLPKDVKLTVLMDNSKDIRRTLSNLSETLYIAVILIFIIIMFFLRRIRPAFVVLISIPVSLIDSFMVQYIFGYTINMVSLLAITIAVGLVVDDALVVMENQIRHQQDLGESPKYAAIYATSEVGRAVTMATFTSCIVFLPMIFATGIAGVIFRQLAVVLVVTLLLSLFDAMMLNPTLCSIFLKPEEETNHGRFDKFFDWSEKQFKSMERFYMDIIAWALAHTKVVILGSLGIFVVSMALVPIVGTEFMPSMDNGQMSISVELPVGTRVEETHKVMTRIEEEFRKIVPENWFETTFWRDGQSRDGGIMGSKSGYHIGSFGANLVEKDKRKMSMDTITEELRSKIKKIPGISRVNSSDSLQRITGSEAPMVINLYGYDLNASYAVAEKIKSIMDNIDGFKDVTITADLTSPEYHVIVDRAKAGAMGISVSQIANTVNLAFAQQKASTYRESGNEYDIVVRMKDEQRKWEPDLENLFVKSPDGKLVKLSTLARFEKTTGPLQIDRENQQRLVKVTANTYGRDLGSLTSELEKKLMTIVFPEGISYSFGGSVEDQRESFAALIMALLLGLMLVYMIIAAQFESLIIPLIIMFSIPFGFVGVIWVFAATGFRLNVATFIGLILMVGLVVKQAIVYLDYALQLEEADVDIKTALIEAGRVRFRPILMTVSAMILGMVPMALSQKQGNEFWQPLALSVIGGLMVSTVITLVLIPSVYYVIFRKRKNRLVDESKQQEVM